MTKIVLLLLVLATPAFAKVGQTPSKRCPVSHQRLADAIRIAEGVKSRHPYGVLSVKVKGEAEARRVCLRSIRNSEKRWRKEGCPGDFVAYFAKRWAPTSGCSNDPNGLNKNWLKNVRKILKQNRSKAAGSHSPS